METGQDHRKKSTMYLFYPLSHVSGSHGIGGRRHEGAARWNISFQTIFGLSRVIFGRFGGSRGGLLGGLGRIALFDRIEHTIYRPIALFDRIGSRLGSIWSGLESPWVVKGRFRASRVLRTPSLGGAKGSQDKLNSDLRRPKIEDKNEDEKRRFRRSSWNGLGSMLGRLECRLGAVLDSKSCSRPRWRSFF